MIQFLRIDDRQKTAALFAKECIVYEDTSAAFGLFENGEMTGYCLYENGEEPVCFLVRAEAAYLVDGLVRSVLNHLALAGKTELNFSSAAPKEILDTLGFLERSPLPIGWFFTEGKGCGRA